MRLPGVALLLLLLLVPSAPGQDQSLGDLARQQRERRNAPVPANSTGPGPVQTQSNVPIGSIDKSGFFWVKRDEPSAYNLRTDFHGIGEGSSEGCHDYCRRNDCIAYRFAHENGLDGKPTTTCTLRMAEGPNALDPAVASLVAYSAFTNPDIVLPPQLARFSADEKRALSHLLTLAFSEKGCWQIARKYLALNQLSTDSCKDESGFGLVEFGPLPAEVAASLIHDEAYNVTLDTTGASALVAFVPKRSGLTGFYDDGTSIHAQADGPATSSSPLLGTEAQIFQSISKTQPDEKSSTASPSQASPPVAPPVQAIHAKHVYTNDEIPSAPSSPASWSVAPTARLDFDLDRPGFTSNVQPLGPLATYKVCIQICDQLGPSCQAWVFDQDARGPRCELKQVVTPGVRKTGVVSGVKAGARVPPD